MPNNGLWSGIWQATFVSALAYGAAVLFGLWIGLWLTLAAIPVFQVVWTLFCGVRLLQLRRSESERESYGFALGGLVSSFALLVLAVVASQAVTAGASAR